jgi:hypothetical protein
MSLRDDECFKGSVHAGMVSNGEIGFITVIGSDNVRPAI